MKYYVRTTFEDVENQQGEYKRVDAALKKANSLYGYNVYDEDGTLIEEIVEAPIVNTNDPGQDIITEDATDTNEFDNVVENESTNTDVIIDSEDEVIVNNPIVNTNELVDDDIRTKFVIAKSRLFY